MHDIKRLTTARAIKLAGSRIKLAALLGVTRQAVQQWGKLVPLKHEAYLRDNHPSDEAWFKWFDQSVL